MAAPDIAGEGFPADLWPDVAPRVAPALVHLELGASFSRVVLAADDLPGDDEAWYRLLPPRSSGDAPELVLSCHPDSFCRPRPLRSTEYPPRAIWEQRRAPRDDEPVERTEFAAARTDAFLHHHLLTLRDLLVGELADRELPAQRAEAFAAAWAVTVDGRLERAGWPGFPLAERRARFSRLFSSAGIILPEHWQIFHALWDGALATRRDVAAIVRQLPRL
ncbi:hypothetical protein KDM41_14290 [bacterium]|nr:hypothetical protein [bacterium]